MIGASESPGWLQTDWILWQFSAQQNKAREKYEDFVRAGVGLPSVWEALQG
jgi:putative transposase